MRDPSVKTRITLIIALIVLLLVSTMLFSISTIKKVKNNLEVQVQTRTAVIALKDNFSLLLAAETAERGYIITADSTYLEPYYETVKRIDSNTNLLRTLLSDHPVQQTNLTALEKFIDLKLAYIEKLIALKNLGNEKEIATVMVSNEGKHIMDDIRAVNRRMQEEEVNRFHGRTVSTAESIEQAKTVFLFEGILSLLITLILAIIIAREFKRRRKIEQELKVSSERFFKIFNENPIATTLSEIGTNKIVFVNDLFQELFGYSKEEVIGHTSDELKLLSPQEQARVYPILLSYLNETRSVEELQALPPEENMKLLLKLKEAMGNNGLEVQYTKKNGKTFDAVLFYDLIEIDGKPYTITSYLDVSKQKKAEKKILDYTMELERKNKEIEQFAYVSSHDLQEPLRSISNFTSLLERKLETHPDQKVHDYMGLITGGVQRMSQLIFDLLEYSRIGNDLEKTKIDCNQLVNEVLTSLQARIKESGAQIHVAALPVVNGFGYLQSLFQNLISNGIKFQKPGTTPVVNISAVQQRNHWLFSISDNGIGIEQEYHERIFIIFQRLHSRREYSGTGIGLAQCRKIVELHGGKIWIESEPGKGSTFYFTLPIA
jgi:CHASE3 domain sensor protein/nitrogen-specific signal transduction histidine kinase